jgi:hypothetical protein
MELNLNYPSKKLWFLIFLSLIDLLEVAIKHHLPEYLSYVEFVRQYQEQKV